MEFTDPAEIADVLKEGLRFFHYCGDPFTQLSSSFRSAFMWVGGTGTSPYLPMFGQKPTNYQKD